MYTSEIKLDVRYYECDQMGIVHHSNYVRFFECGRNQMMKELGIPIEKMEQENIMFPVVSVDIHFKLPSRMGDTLKVVTTLTKKPMAKLLFDQKVYNQRDELVCFGNVVVGFISADRRMPVRAPQIFLEKIEAYFPED
ncbi:MAG: acyl-CoA thioesterase [Bacteroidales bacterium]|nr:acyl-CoA thioesterase [Bacteroidales bacterium]